MQNLQAALKVQSEMPRKNFFLGKVGRLVVGSRQGLEKVIEIRLTAEEKSALERSAAAVRELVSSLRV